MSQGFNSRRHKPDREQEARWALFRREDEDGPLPDDPELLPLLVGALHGRLQRMDRTKDKRLSAIALPEKTDIDILQALVSDLLERIDRLDRTKKKALVGRIRTYIYVLTQRTRWPGELEDNWFRLKLGHYSILFGNELDAIEHGKLMSFTCLPPVLRLQRDTLYEYLSRHARPDGYAINDSPITWMARNARRVHKVISYFKCACEYRSNFDAINIDDISGPGDLIPALLAALHSGPSAMSIRQIIKKSSRPTQIPKFLR